jgi:site-specific DNA-cytosine methylase
MTACVCDGRMSLISLFDGIGGFPLAFSRAGVRTVATVEIDKAAAGVAADHFPEAKHFPDVTEVTPDELLATGFCPVHGVVSAGWPCTDLSLAGLRLGLGGARSGLVGEVFRLLVGLRPRWFVLENVPGLLSSVCPCPGGGICDSPACSAVHTVRGGACGRAIRGGRLRGPGRCMALHGGGMGTVLRRLGECGYGLAYRVLADRRERVLPVSLDAALRALAAE